MNRARIALATIVAAALLGTWIAAGIEHVPDDALAVVEPLWGGTARQAAPGRQFVPPGVRRLSVYPPGERVSDLRDTPVEWGSREGARLAFRARVEYRIRPDGLLDFHRAVGGGDPAARLLRPALAEALVELAATEDPPAPGTPTFRRAVRERLARRLDGAGAELLGWSEIRDLPQGVKPPVRAALAERNLFVLGLDGADWDVIDPLFARGELPNLRRLVEGGARARLRTIAPILSPVVWTTVATGKSPAKHGIVDFLATSTDGSQVPVTSTLWRARSLWDLLGAGGVPVAVTAWWATWPAEPLPGLMATDRIAYQLFQDVVRDDDRSPEGKVWPADLFAEVAGRVVEPAGLSDDTLRPYVDFAALGAPSPEDRERLDELKTVIASTRTYESIAMEWLRRQPSGLHCLYNESTDTAAHLFMPFRPPAAPGIDARRERAFGGVVDAVYREADRMLGRILDRLQGTWNVVVLSDHGFRHGANRPATDPRIGHGPAADWHDRFGVLVLHGPDIRRGVTLRDATVLDVTPTILALYGMPVGEDMDGRVLVEALEPAFLQRHPVETFESYEYRDREIVRAAPSAQDDALMEKLRSLGYIGGYDGQRTPSSRAEEAAGGDATEQFRLDSARAMNNRGVSLLSRGDLDGALEEFQRALAAGGGVPSLVNMANVHLLRRELDDAEAVIGLLASENPDYRALPALEGRLADLRGDTELAARLLDRAIRADPADTHSLTRRGHLAEDSGQLDLAERYFREASRTNPDNAEAWNYLGNVLRKGGDGDGAAAAYRAAVDADPKYPGGYNNLGLLEQSRGRWDEARTLFEEGITRAPRSALLHNSLGSLHLLRGRLEEAEASIRRALELDETMAEAWNNLGVIHARRERLDDARDAFTRAIAADPDNVDAQFNLAKSLLLQRDVNGAFAGFARASDLAPRHRDAAIGAGETALRLGRRDVSIRYFERAAGIAPDSARVHATLGALYRDAGRPADARAALRRSLELAPDQPDVRRLLEGLGG